MMIRINFQTVIIIILLGVLYVMLLDRCTAKEEFKNLQLKYDEDVAHIKDSLGKIISVKDVEIVKNQENIKDLRARLFETTEKYNNKIKEVKALIANGTEVIIKDHPVPYVDTSKMKEWEDSLLSGCASVIQYYSDSTVKIGTQAKDSTPYYKIDATVGKEGIKMNEIKFIDSQYVALTEMKGGILKRNTKGRLKLYVPPTTRVEIKHTNPHFQNTGVDAFLFDKKPTRSYGAGVLHGALGGVIFTALLLTLSP